MSLPETLERSGHTHVRWCGCNYSFFSGCDYFRLSSDPRILRAVEVGIQTFGLSVSASRTTTGNHKLYSDLEDGLARFFNVRAGTIVPTGYLSGLAAAQALRGECAAAFIDERAHPALWDAIGALNCRSRIFRHKDSNHLRKLVNRTRHSGPIVVLTDGMFAFDGSLAPIAEYLKLLPRDAVLMIDDAHAAGILGANGRGTAEHYGIRDQRIVQLITLSKAFGVYGGAVLSHRALRKKIWQRSSVFIGSTPMPLPFASAALSSLEILTEDGSRLRKEVHANYVLVKNALSAAGLYFPDTAGPIIPVYPRSARAKTKLTSALIRARIYPPFLRYPGGPRDGFFRFVISSAHNNQQLNLLARTLVENRRLLSPLPG